MALLLLATLFAPAPFPKVNRPIERGELIGRRDVYGGKWRLGWAEFRDDGTADSSWGEFRWSVENGELTVVADKSYAIKPDMVRAGGVLGEWSNYSLRKPSETKRRRKGAENDANGHLMRLLRNTK